MDKTSKVIEAKYKWQKINEQPCWLLGGIVLLVVIAICIALNAKQVLSAVGVSSKPPVFTFNESSAQGWWAAENYNSQASMAKEKDFKGDEPIDKLSVASINVFKGKKVTMQQLAL